VEAQERWGRKYAAEAWPGLPVEVFADNDISAANGDHRPEYERLRKWVAAGGIGHVWAVEQSRLERREVEWFTLAAELDAAGITELHTDRDGIVRVRDEVAGIKAVLAAGEVRKMRKRLNDTLAEKAANGQPSGSRPFGYEHGIDAEGNKTYVIVPEQAEAIRWAAEKVLAGWSLSRIAAKLRARGLEGPHRVKVRDEAGNVVTDEAGRPVTRAGRLTPQSVRSMVTNPTVAGHRVYQGRIVGAGKWPAILDEDTWQAVRANLAVPRIVRRSDGGEYPIGPAHVGNPAGRRYLLTGGLAVCGVCEAPLTGSIKQLRNKQGVRRVPYLLCHPTKGGRACVGIMLEQTETHVREAMFDAIDRPEFLDALAADGSAARRDQIMTGLAAVERQRDELAGLWALPPGTPGALTMGEWQTARTGLAEHERRLRAELAAVPPPMLAFDIAHIRLGWPRMELDEQRDVLRKVITAVVVHPAKPGTKGFDPGRVSIVWRPPLYPQTD
jgi:DNA invertase Pin-like site-specific DNA recombinase